MISPALPGGTGLGKELRASHVGHFLAGVKLRASHVGHFLAGVKLRASHGRSVLARLQGTGFLRGESFLDIIGTNMAAKGYTFRELEGASGIPQRTLRFWVQSRLLQPPVGKGRGTRYSEIHLIRAKAIRALRAQGLSLNAIRSELGKLTQEQQVSLGATVKTVDAPFLAANPPPEPAYPSTPWEVVNLVNGLVLLVDTTRGPAVRRLASEIYRYYGERGG